MPAPLVTPLPASPERFNKPNSFITDSIIFLDALTPYREQVNGFSSYVNATIPNKWDMGKLTGVRNFPNIFQELFEEKQYEGNSFTFVNYVDTTYSTIKKHSSYYNEVGTWFDRVITEVGLMPYDINKPMVSGITLPMRRDQDRETFNNKAILFTATAMDNINSLYQAMYHTYISCCSNLDCGLITDTTILNSYDMGSVTDTNLEY